MWGSGRLYDVVFKACTKLWGQALDLKVLVLSGGARGSTFRISIGFFMAVVSHGGHDSSGGGGFQIVRAFCTLGVKPERFGLYLEVRG